MLQTSFNKAATKGADEWIKELERFDQDMTHYANLNDDVLETGRVAKGMGIEALKLMDEEKKEKDNDLLRQLSDLDRHLEELEQRRKELVEDNARLTEDNKQLKIDINVLEKALEEQDFGLDEDGKFTNKTVEDTIAAYEKKTGKKIDRNNPNDVQDALFLMIAAKEEQIHQNTIQINKNNREIKGIDEELKTHKKLKSSYSGFSSSKDEALEVTSGNPELEELTDLGGDLLGSSEDHNPDNSLDDLGDDLLESASITEQEQDPENDLTALMDDVPLVEDDKWNPSGIDLVGEFGKAANPPEEKSAHDLKTTDPDVNEQIDKELPTLTLPKMG